VTRYAGNKYVTDTLLA